MDDNTRFLRAILRQDWDTYHDLRLEFERQGKGTPTAIINSAFSLAIRRRFGSNRDMREIIRFVADARAFLSEGRDLPAQEAEALIAVTLDLEEPGVAETVDRLDVGTIAEIEGQLLFKLIRDDKLSDRQLDDLLIEGATLVRQWQSRVEG
jgi:hypothetical protein